MTKKFTKDHEWLDVSGETATFGITQFAADQLGDVVFVEVPGVGRAFGQKEAIAVVESVKAASDVYAPVAGKVLEANAALGDAPETVNEDPEGDGWFAKISIDNPADLDGLMDQAAYDAYISGL